MEQQCVGPGQMSATLSCPALTWKPLEQGRGDVAVPAVRGGCQTTLLHLPLQMTIECLLPQVCLLLLLQDLIFKTRMQLKAVRKVIKIGGHLINVSGTLADSHSIFFFLAGHSVQACDFFFKALQCEIPAHSFVCLPLDYCQPRWLDKTIQWLLSSALFPALTALAKVSENLPWRWIFSPFIFSVSEVNKD